LFDRGRTAHRRFPIMAGGLWTALKTGFLLAHDLFRKPVPIPDQVEDMLFGIMR
jgi:hypothetical protein